MQGTTNPFGGLFHKSPVKPMQEHMRTAAMAAGLVPELLAAALAGDRAKTEQAANGIRDLEHRCDAIENEMRSRLPKSLFMPVDRRDLLEVIEFQDDIADMAQDIAGLVLLRPLELPAGLGGDLIALAKQCAEACNQAVRIIEELDELVEMGFGGREATKVLDMVMALNRVETEADTLEQALLQKLFANEDSIKPVSVVYANRIIEWVGDLADAAEKVGDRLRLLVAR